MQHPLLRAKGTFGRFEWERLNLCLHLLEACSKASLSSLCWFVFPRGQDKGLRKGLQGTYPYRTVLVNSQGRQEKGSFLKVAAHLGISEMEHLHGPPCLTTEQM